MKTIPIMAFTAVLMIYSAGCVYSAPKPRAEAGPPETRLELSQEELERKVGAYLDLTEEQQYILLEAGTEYPFSGEYNNHYETGTYHCSQCGSPLFNSEHKFNSRSGWPSFDAQIPGSVTYREDPDGIRTEVVCTYCEGHLGHVFFGEGFTDTDTRYCVNSLALTFREHKAAVFAAGCFWGVEHRFSLLEGVHEVLSGYTGGNLAAPTYKEVITGTTGHVEAVKVLYDPEVISYRELAETFFSIHDPTQIDGQGPDIGSQYLSVLFYQSEAELETARELTTILEERGMELATSLRPRVMFWPAEEYHQNYYEKQGIRPMCPLDWSIF